MGLASEAGDNRAFQSPDATPTYRGSPTWAYRRPVSKLRTLWRGDYPLADAFWTWAVTVGLFVNLTTSVLFVVMIMRDWPWAALLIGYGGSLPYNAVAVVGVWRSASRYEGPAVHADLARAATAILMAVLSLT